MNEARDNWAESNQRHLVAALAAVRAALDQRCKMETSGLFC